MSDVVKPWRVLHACESVADAVTLAEAQSTVGMIPQLLSREYWNPSAAKQLSLMNAWHDVRDWRHALNETEALTSVQVVHAHSFASAMAGVRGTLPLVYDFNETLGDVAAHQSNGTTGPWLLRSFRVAEQFALTRAGAVVAHTQAMANIAHDRGATNESTFVVAQPWSTTGAVRDVDWLAKLGIHPDREVVIFALAGAGSPECLLKAFASVAAEIPQATLLMESTNEEPLRNMAREMAIEESLRVVCPSERAQAMAWCVLVIAPESGDVLSANAGMLQAMAAGRAVIAADVVDNRECSRDGRGCLWYSPGSELDLAQRTAFVARNRDFARSLGDSAREHISATRAPSVVGREYDQVYKHVHARRNDNVASRPEVPKIYALGMQT